MIDAHQHFWRIGEHGCAWPTADLTRIHRDFMPKDLAPLAQAADVVGSVLMQSQPSNIDTDFLLRLADESSLIRAVVGISIQRGRANSKPGTAPQTAWTSPYVAELA